MKLRFFSYHQKVPYDPPELVLSDKTYGLVSPEPYEWPDRAPLWTAAAYAAFDVALDPDSKEGKAKAVKGDNPQKFLRGDHSGFLESKDRSG